MFVVGVTCWLEQEEARMRTQHSGNNNHPVTSISTMKKFLLLVSVFMASLSLSAGFLQPAPVSRTSVPQKSFLEKGALLVSSREHSNTWVEKSWVVPFALTAFPECAMAADLVVPSALWANAHYFSILAITGCLTAERLIVQPSMTVKDEDLIVKLDLLYGLMAALLIVSGLARATNVSTGVEVLVIDEPVLEGLTSHLLSTVWQRRRLLHS